MFDELMAKQFRIIIGRLLDDDWLKTSLFVVTSKSVSAFWILEAEWLNLNGFISCWL